jgi:hypothetical protein
MKNGLIIQTTVTKRFAEIGQPLQNSAWYVDSRITNIPANDSAKVQWTFNIEQTTNYSLFLQIPEIDNPASMIRAELIYNNDTLINKGFSEPLISNDWIYLGTAELNEGITYNLHITAINNGNTTLNFASDVLKISSLIRERELSPSTEIINFDLVSQIDTASVTLTLENKGVFDLTVSNIQSHSGWVFTNAATPLTIEGMGSKELEVKFFSPVLGAKIDTLFLESDDPLNPVFKIPCFATVETPFFIVDNEDSQNYFESGNWSTSVTQAYGNSSRFSYIAQNPRAYAEFSIKLPESKEYYIEMVVPKTENSSDQAWYFLSVGGSKVDSIQVDQNLNSGNWVNLFTHYLPSDVNVTVKVLDSGASGAGPVLRADAVRFKMVSGISSAEDNLTANPNEFRLMQNYPNPFNPTTKISFNIPNVETLPSSAGKRETSLQTKLTVFDILGREVANLLNKPLPAGTHEIEFDASGLPSGVYFYRLNYSGFSKSMKMLLVK